MAKIGCMCITADGNHDLLCPAYDGPGVEKKPLFPNMKMPETALVPGTVAIDRHVYDDVLRVVNSWNAETAEAPDRQRDLHRLWPSLSMAVKSLADRFPKQ